MEISTKAMKMEIRMAMPILATRMESKTVIRMLETEMGTWMDRIT